MSKKGRGRWKLGIAIAAVMATLIPARAQNHAPNPYRTVEGWGKLPEGRTWGSTSAVHPARDGSGKPWILERCGANSCAGKDDVGPVLLFDPSGKLLKSFGAGMIAWPHGIYVDHENNVWMADAVGYAPVPEGWGHVVYKFSPDDELLLTMGKKGLPETRTRSINR